MIFAYVEHGVMKGLKRGRLKKRRKEGKKGVGRPKEMKAGRSEERKERRKGRR